MSQIKRYIREEKKKIFFLPNTVHNAARSLSSTMPDEYMYICYVFDDQ